MNKGYLDIFISDTFKLVRSITIKSEVTARLINTKLRLLYGDDFVDENNPRSWKYYLNLSGEYHSADELMHTNGPVLLDNSYETVAFTKTLLDHYPEIRKLYAHGTRNFEILLSRYPENLILIMGILTPIDIDKIIDSEDYSIISYDKTLVEHQETTLMRDLNTWLTTFINNWSNMDYSFVDNLYPAAFHFCVYSYLATAILNLRLSRCNTNEAHSFHIRSFLASHQGLDKYIMYLSEKQILFLYRNIRYLERNVGRKETFNLLLERLLKESNIPICDYKMKHFSTFSNDKTPNVIFRNKNLIKTTRNMVEEYHSLSTMLQLETPDAYDNYYYYREHTEAIRRELKSSLSEVLETKVLSSYITENKNKFNLRLLPLIVKQLFYLVDKDFIKYNVGFYVPTFFNEYVLLNPRDSLIYLLFNLNKLYDMGLEAIPDIETEGFFKVTYTDALTPLNTTQKEKISSLLQKNYPIIKETSILKPNNLRVYCTKLLTFVHQARLFTCDRNNVKDKVMLMDAIDRLSESKTIVLDEQHRTYVEWLNDKNIIDYDLSPNDRVLLIRNIIMQLSNFDINEYLNIADLQKSLISMLKKLSSYSIQILYNCDIIENLGVDISEVTNSVSIINPPEIRNVENNADLANKTSTLHNPLILNVNTWPIEMDSFSIDANFIKEPTHYNHTLRKTNTSSMRDVEFYIQEDTLVSPNISYRFSDGSVTYEDFQSMGLEQKSILFHQQRSDLT